MRYENFKSMLKEYIVLDIETTGLSKYRHKITEIAAVKIRNNEVVEEFQTLVNPEVKIPKFITKLTGINNEMVKDAPKVNEVMPNFLDFVGHNVIVAQNASFDYGFLSYNAKEHLNVEMENERLCTIKLARRLVPNIKGRSLANLCEYFSITNETAHRAMSDVIATYQVFQKLHEQLLKAGVEKQKDILRFESLPKYKCEEIFINSE